MIDNSENQLSTFEPSHEEQKLSFEVLSSKLKSFAKESFPEFSTTPVTHLDIIRDSSGLRSFNLPKEFSEFFVTLDTAKFLLISDAPVILKCEEYIMNSKKSKAVQYENLFEIKKFYLKWCIEKHDRETEYFALSVINLIERNANRENFMKYIYGACLSIFGLKRKSLAKALEYLDSAEQTLSSSTLQDEYKTEALYLIHVFKSFAYIADGDKEMAAIALSESIAFKSNGVTALMYSILYPLTEESQSITSRLNGIVDYDLQRFNLAIEHNNINLFGFFLRTAITYNLFRVSEFAPYLMDIRTLLEASSLSGPNSATKLLTITSTLKNSEYKQYQNEKTNKDFDFIITFLERFKTSKNLFIALTFPHLKQKFDNSVQVMKQNIKNTTFSSYMGELDFFDIQTKDHFAKLGKSNEEFEQSKETLRKRVQETHDETEKKYNAVINAVESKLSGIDASPEYDPASVFNNIMVYNVIISIILFVIGGFIGSFSQSTSRGQLSDLFSSLFVYGVRWGGFVFLGGLLIAMISSASKVMERSTEKHRLQKKLTGYKNQKERALERLKKDSERKSKAMEELNQGRVKDMQKKIETLKAEKEIREKEIKDLATKEVAEHCQKIDLMTNF